MSDNNDDGIDLNLVSIDAETPLASVVAIAIADIAARANEAVPLEPKHVIALVQWGQLLNAVAKDHAKLFEERVKKLGLADIDSKLRNHAVVKAANAVAERKKNARKR
jgi:hypothetical protein